MKKQIRSSVFETNSSSTHSIAISKRPVIVGKSINFNIGEFGWENNCVDTADYLYTAILDAYSFEVAEEKINNLKRILDKYNVSYQFEEPKYEEGYYGKYLKYGYVDHAGGCIEFIETVLKDESLLLRYLFGDSTVYTGNDNQDIDLSGCDIADEYYWEEDEYGEYVKKSNPYHDSENYEYFHKGN